jgi:hypothetical protein
MQNSVHDKYDKYYFAVLFTSQIDLSDLLNLMPALNTRQTVISSFYYSYISFFTHILHEKRYEDLYKIWYWTILRKVLEPIRYSFKSNKFNDQYMAT